MTKDEAFKILAVYLSGDSDEAGFDVGAALSSGEVMEALKKCLSSTKGDFVLYRGLHWPSLPEYLEDAKVTIKVVPRIGNTFIYKSEFCSSWSKDPEVAKQFSWNGDAIGIVLQVRLNAESILTDVQNLQNIDDLLRLIPKERRSSLVFEGECIVLPGKYEAKIFYVYDQNNEIETDCG